MKSRDRLGDFAGKGGVGTHWVTVGALKSNHIAQKEPPTLMGLFFHEPS